MHTKTFVIEMPDSIDIQPETIVYALSYISNLDFVVKEAAQQSVERICCTDCGEVVSDNDATCPKCGLRNPANR